MPAPCCRDEAPLACVIAGAACAGAPYHPAPPPASSAGARHAQGVQSLPVQGPDRGAEITTEKRTGVATMVRVRTRSVPPAPPARRGAGLPPPRRCDADYRRAGPDLGALWRRPPASSNCWSRINPVLVSTPSGGPRAFRHSGVTQRFPNGCRTGFCRPGGRPRGAKASHRPLLSPWRAFLARRRVQGLAEWTSQPGASQGPLRPFPGFCPHAAHQKDSSM